MELQLLNFRKLMRIRDKRKSSAHIYIHTWEITFVFRGLMNTDVPTVSICNNLSFLSLKFQSITDTVTTNQKVIITRLFNSQTTFTKGKLSKKKKKNPTNFK
jgi:hypothetical protein